MKQIIFFCFSLILIPSLSFSQKFTTDWQSYDGNRCLRNGLEYKRTSEFMDYLGENGKWQHVFIFRHKLNETALRSLQLRIIINYQKASYHFLKKSTSKQQKCSKNPFPASWLDAVPVVVLKAASNNNSC